MRDLENEVTDTADDFRASRMHCGARPDNCKEKVAEAGQGPGFPILRNVYAVGSWRGVSFL